MKHLQRRSTQTSVSASRKGARSRAKMLEAQAKLKETAADPESVKVIDQAVKRFSGAIGRLGDR